MVNYEEHQKNVLELCLMIEKDFPNEDPKEIGKVAKTIYFTGLECFMEALKEVRA
jgi:hypothetical protein